MQTNWNNLKLYVCIYTIYVCFIHHTIVYIYICIRIDIYIRYIESIEISMQSTVALVVACPGCQGNKRRWNSMSDLRISWRGTSIDQFLYVSLTILWYLGQEDIMENCLKLSKISIVLHVGVSKNRGTPKWMVYFMENPMNKWMI